MLSSIIWSQLCYIWYINEYMYFNQKDISTLNGGSLKFVDKFNYLGSSISSTENDISKQLEKAWTAIDIGCQSYGNQTYLMN